MNGLQDAKNQIDEGAAQQPQGGEQPPQVTGSGSGNVGNGSSGLGATGLSNAGAATGEGATTKRWRRIAGIEDRA